MLLRCIKDALRTPTCLTVRDVQERAYQLSDPSKIAREVLACYDKDILPQLESMIIKLQESLYEGQTKCGVREINVSLARLVYPGQMEPQKQFKRLQTVVNVYWPIDDYSCQIFTDIVLSYHDPSSLSLIDDMFELHTQSGTKSCLDAAVTFSNKLNQIIAEMEE